jgi:hypothetical protein
LTVTIRLNLLVVHRPPSFLLLFFVPNFFSVWSAAQSLPSSSVKGRCHVEMRACLGALAHSRAFCLCVAVRWQKEESREVFLLRIECGHSWSNLDKTGLHLLPQRRLPFNSRLHPDTYRNTCTVSTDKGSAPNGMAADLKSLPVEWYA